MGTENERELSDSDDVLDKKTTVQITVVSSIVEDFEKIYIDPKSGGTVWRHRLVNELADDYNAVYEVAVDKANLGCRVNILPILTENDPLRNSVFQGAKHRKCPDMTIDSVYTEIKNPVQDLHDNKIDNNIKHGYDQADNVIIRLPADYSLAKLSRIVKRRFLRHEGLKVVEFKIAGKYHIFKRSDLL